MFNVKGARREPCRSLNVAGIMVVASIRVKAVRDMPASVKLLRHKVSPLRFASEGQPLTENNSESLERETVDDKLNFPRSYALN